MARHFVRFVTGIAIVTSAGLANAQTNAAPNPDDVYITGLVYNGSGCPSGSVKVRMADDARSFSLDFTKLVATAGPGISISSNRKNCAISVQIHVPGGFSFAIQSVEYAGRAKLDPRVTGTQLATYWFQGEALQTQSSMVLTGPVDQNYDRMDTIPFENLVFSPCGQTRSTNINAEVRVSNAANKTGKGSMVVETTTGKMETTFHLAFEPCL